MYIARFGPRDAGARASHTMSYLTRQADKGGVTAWWAETSGALTESFLSSIHLEIACVKERMEFTGADPQGVSI